MVHGYVGLAQCGFRQMLDKETHTRNLAAFKALRFDYDEYDKWTWSMSWLFDLCNYVEANVQDLDVPAELEYRPGLAGPAPIDDEMHVELLDAMEVPALLYAMRVLNRYTDLLRKHGESY